MVRNIQIVPQPRLVGDDCAFVFAVGTDGYAGFGKDPFECVLIIDQQIARARTDKDLDAWYTLHAS